MVWIIFRLVLGACALLYLVTTAESLGATGAEMYMFSVILGVLLSLALFPRNS